MSDNIELQNEHKNGRGYEQRDADVKSLVNSGIGLFVIVVVAIGLMGLMLSFMLSERERVDVSSHPLAPERLLPPSPRLQVQPDLDMETFQAIEDSILNEYGWVQQEAGVVRIPIDEAMKKTLEKGLPHR